MAVTITTPTGAAVTPIVAGNVRVVVAEILFDSSYPTGGEPLTASDLGLQQIVFAVATHKTAGTGAVTGFWYDAPNAKLKAYTASAEVSNTTDLSAVSAQILAWGK